MRLALIAGLSVVMVGGCRREAAAPPVKAPPPAKVDGAVKEADLLTIRLTAQAEERLGIETAPIEKRAMGRVRTLGGEVIVPHGGTVRVAAPLAGTLLAGAVSGGLLPGLSVKRGEVLLKLSPVLAGAEEVLPAADRLALIKARADLSAALVEAQGAVASAEVRLEAAKVTFERADELRRQKVGSAQDFDQAQAELRMAETALKAARARLEVLRDTRLEAHLDSIPALDIKAPQDGVLRTVSAVAGQEVNAGQELFEVITTDPLWVRVPVYVGDMGTFDHEKQARLRLLGDSDPTSGREIKRISADPSADVLSATADLFFTVANPGGTLLPGQRVLVDLPVRGPEQSLVAPWSAVVYDTHGGSWVYEKLGPGVYTRRRVEVRSVIEEKAVLDRGPAPGTQIVMAGAAELFGTEFGIGK